MPRHASTSSTCWLSCWSASRCNIAALAFDSDDTYLRGTALEYLETVLPSGIFAALAPRLSTAPVPVLHQRGAAVLRAELLEAGATMRVSRKQLLTGAERPRSRRRKLGP